MKLIVCESCESEFKVKHDLDDRIYNISFCIFCGEPLSEELEDEVDWDEDE